MPGKSNSASSAASASSGAASPWDWWRGVDDLWRWGAQSRELWADDLADAAVRQAARLRRIAAMLAHARSRSGFYRRHYAHLPTDCADLASHPPVTRSELMANFDQWVTDPQVRKAEVLDFVADPRRVGEPYLGRYAVWTSSGTTGVPGIYVQDADALAAYSALLTTRFQFGSALSDSWRMMTGPSRMAMVAAIDGHFAGVVSWERQRRLHPTMAHGARAFSILQPLAELVAELNEWAPAYLASYPTMLALLARERREGRLTIQPQALWSGGECLLPADRATMEEGFGCPVVEDYGASECMNIAFACGKGRLHVNDDRVVLEPVDEHFRLVPVGATSATVLVTNLMNRVQPMIRYDLGDSITMDDSPCACGSTRPSIRIGGRCGDVVVLAAGAGGGANGGSASRGPVRLLPLAIETVIEEEAHVHRFQLTQTGADEMSLRLGGDDPGEQAEAFRRVSEVLDRFLKRQGAAPVKLTLDPGPPEVHPVSGKLRQVRVLEGVAVADR